MTPKSNLIESPRVRRDVLFVLRVDRHHLPLGGRLGEQRLKKKLSKSDGKIIKMSFEQDVAKQIWQIKNQLTKHDGAIEVVK